MTLNSIAKRSFALYRKKLDPHKHMFMTKNIENMYESYSWPGRIFEITRAPIRQPAIKTTESVAKVIFDFFKRVAPQNFTFEIEDYDKVRQNSWWVYEVDFDAHNSDLKEELKQHCLRFVPGLDSQAISEFFDTVYKCTTLDNEFYRNHPIENSIEYYAQAYTFVIDNAQAFMPVEPRLFDVAESDVDALLKAENEPEGIAEPEKSQIAESSGKINTESISPVCKLMAWMHS